MKGTGRIKYYDPQNENYRIKDVVLPRRIGFMREVVRKLGIRDTRSWHQRMFYYQGEHPACTGYGSATLIAAEPVRPKIELLRAINPMQWYRDNVEQDRKEGRFYSGGATTLAAMKVGKRYGYWGEYRWAYTVDEFKGVIHDTSPVIVGTNWYDSMWDRDGAGIARITKTSQNVGGHLWCINGYDPRKALFRHPSTWNDGYYFIPEEDLVRLMGEDGECAVVRELVPQIAA